MLVLLAPGVGMGGAASGAPATPDTHLLMLMGVGRILIPFLWVRGWLGV